MQLHRGAGSFHIALVHRFMHLQFEEEEEKALEPVVTWHNEPDRGYTSAHICTWDRSGLFWKIAGSLTAAGLNILSAQIFTRSDGIVLDSFYVNDAQGAVLARKEGREAFEKNLLASLTGKDIDLPGLIAQRGKANPLYQALHGEPVH